MQVGFANEIRHKFVLGCLVNFTRSANLLHVPPFDHRDAIGHSQRFFLVVGNEDESNARLLLNLLQFQAHRLTQFLSNAPSGSSSNKTLGRAQVRGPRRHVVVARQTIAAGSSELNKFQHLCDTGLGCGFILTKAKQTKHHVLRDIHVREQRVLLENCVNRPLVWQQIRDVLAIQYNRAFGDIFEPSDGAQQRGFAAARRPKQREKLVVADIEVHVF